MDSSAQAALQEAQDLISVCFRQVLEICAKHQVSYSLDFKLPDGFSDLEINTTSNTVQVLYTADEESILTKYPESLSNRWYLISCAELSDDFILKHGENLKWPALFEINRRPLNEELLRKFVHRFKDGVNCAWQTLVNNNLYFQLKYPPDNFILEFKNEIPPVIFNQWLARKRYGIRDEKSLLLKKIKNIEIKQENLIQYIETVKSNKNIPPDNKKKALLKIDDRIQKMSDQVNKLRQEMLELDKRYAG